MAITLTSNLKLRLSSDLTTDSKYNLQRIDTLGSVYQVDSNQVAKVRSQTDILFQTNDTDIGGIGSGGTINFGTIDTPVGTINLNATTLALNNTSISSTGSFGTSGAFVLEDGDYGISLQAPTLSSSYSLTFPAETGTINQVLITDGNGILSWANIAGVGGSSGQELSATWSAVDGAIKTIVHNLGTRKIMVQILDATDNYKAVDVDAICRPDDNTITLESSIIPVNWLVLLKEIT